MFQNNRWPHNEGASALSKLSWNSHYAATIWSCYTSVVSVIMLSWWYEGEPMEHNMEQLLWTSNVKLLMTDRLYDMCDTNITRLEWRYRTSVGLSGTKEASIRYQYKDIYLSGETLSVADPFNFVRYICLSLQLRRWVILRQAYVDISGELKSAEDQSERKGSHHRLPQHSIITHSQHSGIHRTLVTKHVSDEIHPGYETCEDITGSPKQGYPWPHKKGLMSSKKCKINTEWRRLTN